MSSVQGNEGYAPIAVSRSSECFTTRTWCCAGAGSLSHGPGSVRPCCASIALTLKRRLSVQAGFVAAVGLWDVSGGRTEARRAEACALTRTTTPACDTEHATWHLLLHIPEAEKSMRHCRHGERRVPQRVGPMTCSRWEHRAQMPFRVIWRTGPFEFELSHCLSALSKS